MNELTALTLAAARDGLKKKAFSAAELAQAHLAAIEEARALNAFVLETPERALEMAKAADARMAKGEAGPLEGIPARHQGHVLHARLCARPPARTSSTISCRPTSSTVTANLWRDGAVLLGQDQ